jgi:hypothetical protein
MNKVLLVIIFLFTLSSCWPGPSYKGLDSRCREWITVTYGTFNNDEEQRRFVATLNVFDRYQYYSCKNVMRSWSYKDHTVFVDDAEEFFELVRNMLRDRIDKAHLYLITRISVDIAQARPDVVKKNMELIDHIETMVPIGASDFLGEFTLRNIKYIKYYAK